MSLQAQLAMILWLPIVLYLFNKYPPRKAVIVGFLGGLLFLPQRAGFNLPLIPDYRGMVATCYGIFIGIIIYDSEVFNRFELKWIDYPMILFGIAPLFSSLTNGLGLYDGINQSISQTVQWGMPYFLGRLYLNNLAGLKELAINIVKAGLLYVPLCLYEVRMSPQLHNMVYGYFPHSFAQTMRFGGWRPQVFMQHGLMVGLFMMTATLIAIWLWQGRVVAKIWRMPMEWVVVILFVTFILLKSTGAYALMAIGLIILFSAKWFRLNLPLILVLLAIVGYLVVASTGNLQTDNIISSLQQVFPEDRVASLEFRFDNEELLGEKARERVLFGWGGWGRNRVYAENWAGEIEDISVTDSLWIIVFGINGLFGLISLFASLILPVVYLIIRYPVNTWLIPKVSSAMVLGVCLTLFVVDCLVNSMFNPIFPLIGGGLSGLFVYSPQITNKTMKRNILIHQKSQKKSLNNYSISNQNR
ncbi:O-antigen ligase domain-containing protein [Cyanobacterium aponinum AL20118]|uniref:O-antigen ligase domain-containing protein n=1 Tax=Cyanobacterium aponinum AL20115 TaxID=3090662 RepID=A0AAF0ZF90_9CHRO|nr:O-antigen ligase domain-containing protein [Cyanobacterium aponinum]WPF89308.1 O-antigen ligase domain-containing protein [Cyanobacterium aponinum AL20115]